MAKSSPRRKSPLACRSRQTEYGIPLGRCCALPTLRVTPISGHRLFRRMVEEGSRPLLRCLSRVERLPWQALGIRLERLSLGRGERCFKGVFETAFEGQFPTRLISMQVSPASVALPCGVDDDTRVGRADDPHQGALALHRPAGDTCPLWDTLAPGGLGSALRRRGCTRSLHPRRHCTGRGCRLYPRQPLRGRSRLPTRCAGGWACA